MNGREPQTAYGPLMYMLGSFRQSERESLLRAAHSAPLAFTEALASFLQLWAEASWLEEYNVERVGEWIAHKCPVSVSDAAREHALDMLRRTEGDAIFRQTYEAFLLGMKRQTSSKRNVHLHAVM